MALIHDRSLLPSILFRTDCDGLHLFIIQQLDCRTKVAGCQTAFTTNVPYGIHCQPDPLSFLPPVYELLSPSSCDQDCKSTGEETVAISGTMTVMLTLRQ